MERGCGTDGDASGPSGAVSLAKVGGAVERTMRRPPDTAKGPEGSPGPLAIVGPASTQLVFALSSFFTYLTEQP